jgi:hypothetical protein
MTQFTHRVQTLFITSLTHHLLPPWSNGNCFTRWHSHKQPAATYRVCLMLAAINRRHKLLNKKRTQSSIPLHLLSCHGNLYVSGSMESWGHSVTDWPTGSTLFTLGQSDDATMDRHMSPVTYAVCWPLLPSSRKPEAKDAERNPTHARMTLSYSSADANDTNRESRYTNYLPLRLINILIKNRVTEQWRKPSKTLFVLLNSIRHYSTKIYPEWRYSSILS